MSAPDAQRPPEVQSEGRADDQPTSEINGNARPLSDANREHLERVLSDIATVEDLYEKCAADIARTDTYDPEIHRLRDDLDGEISRAVVDWCVLGEPDEFEVRFRALRGFDRWYTAGRADDATSAAFADLGADDDPAPWDTSPPKELPMPVAFDDANLGEAFGRVIAGRYLYCRGLGGWLRFDGARWKRDSTEAVFEECRRYVLELGRELFRLSGEPDDIKRVASYRSKGRIDAVVTIARRLEGIASEPEEFDRHPGLLCCANGVIDLRTGVLAPHDPDLRLTKTTSTDYRKDATHADVDAVLDVADEQVRDWLQVLFGYASTGHVSEDLMPVFDGRGSNGKTTLLGAVSAALGEYACPAPEKLLMSGSGDEHPTLFAELFGRRLITIEETAEGGSLRVEKMKALTGGSKITARFIARDYFTFDPTHLLIIATNHRPAVNSVEHATWRRLRLVPFPHRYEQPDRMRDGDRPVDRGLRLRLTRRQQREAMLAWIVAGAVRWFADGIGSVSEVDDATDAWRNSEDVIHRFVEDRLTFDAQAHTTLAALYDEYTEWCSNEGRPAGSQKEFGKRFEDHDTVSRNHVSKGRTKAGWRWNGVAIRPPGDTGDIHLIGFHEITAQKPTGAMSPLSPTPELQGSEHSSGEAA